VQWKSTAKTTKGFVSPSNKHGDRFVCCVYTGAFGYHIIEQFTAQSGLRRRSCSPAKTDALAHAKTQIDTDKLKAWLARRSRSMSREWRVRSTGLPTTVRVPDHDRHFLVPSASRGGSGS